MKPRQRVQQKQSSRLYLRTKDHRDVIYQDMYHNAIWGNTENIDDELSWVKYPNHALMTKYFGWMDVDRQFEYCINNGGGGGHSVRIRKLECGLIVRERFYSTNNWDAYVSEDGIVWQEITDSGYQNYTNHFGEDGFCRVETIISGSTALRWEAHIVRFVKDEEDGLWHAQYRNYTYGQGENPPIIFPVCHDSDGIIACQQVRYNTNPVVYDETYIKINWNGIVESRTQSFNISLSFPMGGYAGSPETIRYCKNGDKLACAFYAFNSADGYNYPIVRTSSDDGYTWTTSQFGKAIYYNYTYVYKLALFCRQGNFYFMIGCGYPDRDGAWKANETVMFASYGGTDWTQQQISAYADVDVLQEGGQGIVDNPSIGQSIRIAADPQNTSGYDYMLMDLLGDQTLLDYGDFNLMVSKGEIVEPSEEDFWATFTNGTIYAYFDNRSLQSSENNFAWQQTSYNASKDGAEYLQTGDYCVEGVIT